jgi:DNA-binding response OmpR family regulator
MVETGMAEPLILRFQDLTIDLDRYRVFLGDRRIVLSYREYALLVYLAGKAGQAVHKRQLLEEGLGRHDFGGLRIVDEHVRRLKSMLEREGCSFIHEVGESGYRFEAKTAAQGPFAT